MKKTELMSELRELDLDDLIERARERADERMKLRFRNVTGQLEQNHRLKELRRELARIETIIAEKHRSSAVSEKTMADTEEAAA